MPRDRDSEYEPSAPPYREPNLFGSNNAYTQVPPTSPFSGSDPSLTDVRTPQLLASSPLNPRAAGDRTMTTTPSGTEWTSFGVNDRGQDYPNSSLGSSRSSQAEKEQMKSIMAGNVGGNFTPYPESVAATFMLST